MSGEDKETFIGSGVSTGLVQVQVLQGVELEMEPREDHAFEVEPQGNFDHVATRDRDQYSARELFRYREDNNEAAFAMTATEKIYAHESLTFNDTVACGMISKCNVGLKEDMNARIFVYVLAMVSLEKSSDTLKAITGSITRFDRGLQTDVHVFVVSTMQWESIDKAMVDLSQEVDPGSDGSSGGSCCVSVSANSDTKVEIWVGKIADLGLSKLNYESSEGSNIVSNACGTYGYFDRDYNNNSIMRKECDVYSFGIVLFEVLCGMLCSPHPNKDKGIFMLSGPSDQ
ncbi:zinc finger, CCHC-type containing protein [Tanacetum coccineum]